MTSESSSDSEDDSYYGPKPPPLSQPSSSSTPRKEIIGPDLPPGFSRKTADDEGDEDMPIGPLLPSQDDSRKYCPSLHREPDEEDKGSKREEWMTVVPDKVEQKLGLTSIKSVTSFSKKPVGKEIPKPEEPSSRDKEMEQMMEKSDRKRQASLLSTHQEKLKKKRKDGKEDKKERKPLDFNPEKDLHTRHFDERQTKSVIEKSKLLNSRFSSGSNKYL